MTTCTFISKWSVRQVLNEKLAAAVDTQDEDLFKRVVSDLVDNELFTGEEHAKRFAWVPEYIAESKD